MNKSCGFTRIGVLINHVMWSNRVFNKLVPNSFFAFFFTSGSIGTGGFCHAFSVFDLKISRKITLNAAYQFEVCYYL